MSGNEFEFIDWVKSQAVINSATVETGIGDDAAVLNLAEGKPVLIAKDVLMEGTHFTFPPATPQLAGRKALAVNLSDIAAMGGMPRQALVGLCLPRSRGVQFAREVHQGIQDLADEFGVSVIGGDTNTWDGPLVVSVTVLGDVPAGRPILRRGAMPGDWICISGALGGSYDSQRHLTFTPRVRLAEQLRELVPLHAMIDVSDGLGSDLRHILNQSGVGAVLDATAIPIHPDVPQNEPFESRLEHALSDGEDFELLFTIPGSARAVLTSAKLDVPVHCIGEVTADSGLRIKSPNGQVQLLESCGYQHRFAT